MEFAALLGPRVTTERLDGIFSELEPFYADVWRARTGKPPNHFTPPFSDSLRQAQISLMNGEVGLKVGKADFIAALATQEWTSVCSGDQQDAVYQILIDGLLDRLDRQPSFFVKEITPDAEEDRVSRFNWLARFNSCGYILPSIESLWIEWWKLDSFGKAIAALEYIWGIGTSEKHLFMPQPLDLVDYLCPDGAIFDQAWNVESLEFFSRTLNTSYLISKAFEASEVINALDSLPGEYDKIIVRRMTDAFVRHREMLESRIGELIDGLGKPPVHRAG